MFLGLFHSLAPVPIISRCPSPHNRGFPQPPGPSFRAEPLAPVNAVGPAEGAQTARFPRLAQEKAHRCQRAVAVAVPERQSRLPRLETLRHSPRQTSAWPLFV